jgi:ArsR family transcriptional regulator, arsenate/arsenite/antimonite-responsive transcriptional repressor
MNTLPVLCCGPATPALDEGEADMLAAQFKALADPARVTILNRLAAADEVCVCDFVAALDLAQPTVSHHLKVLRDAGLVESSRRGTWAFYRLVPEAVDALRDVLSPR